LIILDINLPDLSGHEVRRRLKTDPATAAIPVLHLSASFVESDNRAEGLEGGADGYLTYPVEPRELFANIEALLRTRRAEREALAQRELLQVTLNSIGDAVIATDADGRITFLNPAAQSLTGWSQNDAAGKPLSDVFRVVDERTRKPATEPVEQVLREGKVVGLSTNFVLTSRDGTERAIDDSAAPIRDANGKVVGVVVVFRDVTDRRRSEDALRRSEEALKERADALADVDRRKDEFLATLAHELRNPLAPLRNALHLAKLADPNPIPDVKRARDVMDRQIEHLIRLVDDLLDMSRINRGKVRLRKERVDLADVVARAVESSRPAIDERKHTLEISLPEEPILLEADAVRLAQVFLNLLTNASKYTPVGGLIRLSAEIGSADGIAPPRREVVVRVRDTGMGIAAELLPKVFDLFTQAERSLDRADGGLGVGLSLVRQLTELHGGTVTATSEGHGRGSEFSVRLPMAQGAAPAVPSAARTTSDVAARSFNCRVLVVDDNRDSADSLALLLRLMGHDVRTAHDGRLAVEVAAAYCPQIVFLDIGLPGLNGLEVCQRLRGTRDMNKAVIVAVTGYGQDEDKRRSKEAGFDAHLIKPIDMSTLQTMMADPHLVGGVR
jgi:PAS domain S-box-containing protein